MSINEVVTKTNNAVIDYNDDPFMSYGIEAANLGTSFLKYEKGSYYYDKDNKVMPLGSKLAGNMASVRTGWIKWVGGYPADKILNLLIERRPKIERPELGDMDSAMWEDPNKDPWQEAAEFELVDGYGKRFTFNTSTNGGTKAVKNLVYNYARERRSRPGQAPLIELQSDFYMHPNTKYGKVLIPVLAIVDWVDETTLAPVANGSGEAAPDHLMPVVKEQSEEAPDHLMPTEDPPHGSTARGQAFVDEEKPIQTKAKGPVPVLKAKSPRF